MGSTELGPWTHPETWGLAIWLDHPQTLKKSQNRLTLMGTNPKIAPLNQAGFPPA